MLEQLELSPDSIDALVECYGIRALEALDTEVKVHMPNTHFKCDALIVTEINGPKLALFEGKPRPIVVRRLLE